MDDRQTKIREGAGLEDSRVNQEFIDFLNKWSSPVLIVLAIAALTWAGLQKLEQMRNDKIDRAFSEYESVVAGGNPSPNSLKTIAEESADVRSVSHLARLREVDLYLGAYALGLAPGAQIDQNTQSVSNPDDILDEERREQYRSLAETTAKQVLSATEGDDDKVVFAMQALSRLASVEESRDAFDAARSYYERLGSMAEQHRFPSIKTFAQQRIAGLDALANVGALPTNEQVPALTPAFELPELPSTPEPSEGASDEGTAPDGEPEGGADTDATSGDEPEGSENP